MLKIFTALFLLFCSPSLLLGQACLLEEVTITPVECNIDGSYEVSISIVPDSFDVTLHVNGVLESTFYHTDTAVIISNIQSSGMSQDTFSVNMANAPDSCALSLLINNPCLCGFNNFNFDIFDCDEVSNTYYIDLNFDYYNNGLSFNMISSLGVNGIYEYADLPISLGPFSTAASGPSFTFVDVDDLTCFAIEELDPIDCAVVNACMISNVFASPQACMVDGSFYVDIEFDVLNPALDGFLIQGNGNSYGNFNYGEAFYTIGPLLGDCSTIYEFIVTDFNDATCSALYAFDDPVCCTVVPCAMDNMVFSPICVGSDLIGFDLDFNYSGNVSETFTVTIDQQLIGTFNYNDLPLSPSLIGVTISDLLLDILIIDSDDLSCNIELNGFEVICLSNCMISEVEAVLFPCDGNLFNVEISFDVIDPAASTYSVLGNGNNYGSFDYSENPVVIGPLEADCLTVLGFVVMDDIDSNCSGVFDFTEAVCCGECEIDDMAIDLISCSADLVSFTINFNHANTSGQGFDLYSRNGFFGFYSYTFLPLSIIDFPNTGQAMEFVRVCDNDDPDCCLEFEFLLENCTTVACTLTEVMVELQDCNSTEMTFVLNFDYTNNPSSTFDLFSRNGFFGNFNYNDLPLTIMGFPNTGSPEEYINICDHDDISCCIAFEFLLDNCTSECLLSEVMVALSDCDETEMTFVLDFDYSNNPSSSFDLYSRNGFFGNFNYGDLPLTVIDFPNTGLAEEFINICDQDDPACCIAYEFSLGDCFMPCLLWNLNIDAIECNQDSVWFNLDFLSDNIGKLGFELVANGVTIGTYDYDLIPFVVGVALNPNGGQYGFVINDIEIMDCSVLGIAFLELVCTTSNNDVLQQQTLAYFNGKELVVNSNEAILELTLYNYIGQEISHQKESKVLNLNSFMPGIYILKIKTSAGDLLKKVFLH